MKNLYVCGPTVYSSPHIGNMRPILTFDIYRRALEYLGEKVNFIHNITDIDDKIIKKASEENILEMDVANKYEAEYMDLLKQANIIKPDSMPKVVENMDEIIKYINTLIDKGNAYESKGNVFFSVQTIPEYGNISNRTLDSMRYEENLESAKKHPADFALWKSTDVGLKFNSPWGYGRPGWHTECSVFIDKFFGGKPVDIHGGGIDLIFPHHENENVQHCAMHEKPIAKEWKHMGHLNFDGDKMSKSLGNVLGAKEYFEKFSADTLRYIFLTTSYSAPINLTHALSEQAFDQVEKFRKIYLESQTILEENIAITLPIIANDLVEWRFTNAMKGINLIIKEFNKNKNSLNANKLINAMKLLGFGFTKRILTPKEKQMVKQWKQFRSEKMYEKSDQLRESLVKNNII